MTPEIKHKILTCFKNQSELAKWLAVTEQAVSHWFIGKQKISVKNAAKLANKIGCDLLDIREDLR